MRKSICLLFFFLSSCSLFSQSPAYVRYNSFSGLPCNEVYDVIQDHLGFIWTATDRGIFRFDGYSFEAFTTAQGLTDNTVFRICEDFRGRIWSMPFNGELCCIDNGRVTVYPFNDTLKNHLPGIRIARSLNVLPSGEVQIGYLIHGIVSVSAEGVFRRISTRKNYKAEYYMMDTGGGLLYGMQETAGMKTGTRLQFTSEGMTDEKLNFEKFSGHQQIAGIRRRNGGWCFALMNELVEISPQGTMTEQPLPKQPLCVYEDNENCLWVTMDAGGGVRRYRPGKTACGETVFDTYYPGESVSRIMQDAEGAFWIATLSHGLFYVPSVHTLLWNIPGDEEDKVVCLAEAGKDCTLALWRDKGLFRLSGGNSPLSPVVLAGDNNSFRWVTFDSLRSRLFIAERRFAEACSWPGLQEEKKWGLSIQSFETGAQGTFCCESWQAAFLDSSDEWKQLGPNPDKQRPDVIFEERGGKTWVGRMDGLFYVSHDTLVPFASPDPVFRKRVSGICSLDDGTLVVATQSSGIAWIKNGETRLLSDENGIITDHVLSIMPGKGNSLWLTTIYGLYNVRNNNGVWEKSVFPEVSCFLSNDGRCYFTDKDGDLWMSTGASVIRFDPDHSFATHYLPPVYLREIIANGKEISSAQNISLPYDHNFLRISFAGLAYRMHGHLRYRYRLSQEDPQWTYTYSNSVELASLGPGNYTFEVQAENERGVWSSAPAFYSFTILPPVWQMWWFRIAAFLVLSAIFFLLIRYRFRQLKRQAELREQAQDFRQQALALQMNPHFVFNALNTIQAYVLKEDKSRAIEMFSSFAQLLRKSLDHARERYITLAGEIEMLGLYFGIESLRFEERLKYSITVDKNIDTSMTLVPAMLVQPLVENAIRHGIMNRKAGGHVDVRFEMEDGKLFCAVEDNGVGRATAAKLRAGDHRSAGSDITADRLRVLCKMSGAQFYFSVTDKTDKNGNATGTLVRFAIPFTGKKQEGI
ncbi:MAG TPA: histidine kinase [Bacteroidia bacterium]|nr:histidine kinase [Bacteroidia bacterium]